MHSGGNQSFSYRLRAQPLEVLSDPEGFKASEVCGCSEHQDLSFDASCFVLSLLNQKQLDCSYELCMECRVRKDGQLPTQRKHGLLLSLLPEIRTISPQCLTQGLGQG